MSVLVIDEIANGRDQTCIMGDGVLEASVARIPTRGSELGVGNALVRPATFTLIVWGCLGWEFALEMIRQGLEDCTLGLRRGIDDVVDTLSVDFDEMAERTNDVRNMGLVEVASTITLDDSGAIKIFEKYKGATWSIDSSQASDKAARGEGKFFGFS